jgi:hypothetical protein
VVKDLKERQVTQVELVVKVLKVLMVEQAIQVG